MTMPTNPTGGREPMSLDEIRSLLANTAQMTAENSRAIAEMRVAEVERAARHDKEMTEFRAAQDERDARRDKEIAEFRAAQEERDARRDKEMTEFRIVQDERNARHDKEMGEIRAEQAKMRVEQDKRDARHDKEMGEIRAAIAELTAAQQRTSQDVSTLKGWGLEIFCERHPEVFSDYLGLDDAELIPKRDIMRIASAAQQAGIIAPDQRRSLIRADAFFYARREADHQPFCLVVETSFRVDDDDVERAAGRAEILDAILKKYQPRNLNGQVIPIVAGTDIEPGAWFRAQNFNVQYVQVQNGNLLTNPPE